MAEYLDNQSTNFSGASRLPRSDSHTAPRTPSAAMRKVSSCRADEAFKLPAKTSLHREPA